MVFYLHGALWDIEWQCFVSQGMVWHGMARFGASYIVIRQLGKQSAVLSSRHWGGGWLKKHQLSKNPCLPMESGGE